MERTTLFKHISSVRTYRLIVNITLWCLLASLVVLPDTVDAHSSVTHPSPVDAHNPAVPSFTRHFLGQEATWSLATGDFNGDGTLDIVRENNIYFNDGEGHFTASHPIDVAYTDTTGDLNGDGTLDIVMGNNIYFNDGEGNFSTPHPIDVTFTISDIALGDLNGDRALDIVFGDSENAGTIYLNEGNGRFWLSQTLEKIDAGGYGVNSVAVGDLNGDGALDIVMGDGDDPNTFYLNDGNGSFGTPQILGGRSSNLALGDLNGDDALDIITVGMDSLSVVYLNDGQGNFPSSERLGDISYYVVLGDLNGDDALDIITVNLDGFSSFYLNDGQGNFPSSYGLEGIEDIPHNIALGDLNGDSALDVILGNIIYFNEMGSNFRMPQPLTDPNPEGDGTTNLALGDLNGDGALDIVVGNDTQPNTFYLNNGQGIFASAQPIDDLIPRGYRRTRLALGDLNSDGTLDIVVGESYGPNIVYFNDGNASFTPQLLEDESNEITSLAVGDLNGDGALDIVVGGSNIVYLNEGMGTFTTPQPLDEIGGSDTRSIALGDLNGDGALDIVAGNNYVDSVVYLNDGSGIFRSAQPLGNLVADSDWTDSIALGDLNGDGALDIVAGNGGNQPNTIYLNEGMGTFTTPQPLDEIGGSYTSSIALGDLNGDGALDIVAGNSTDPHVIYMNEGMGTFTASQPLDETRGGYTRSIVLGDLNSDGALDIVTGNYDGPNTVYLNYLANHTRLPNNPPFVAVTRPGVTGNANFFSTAEIISETNTVEVPYKLFDLEGDSVRAIDAFYSLNGGGQWFPTVAAEPPGLDASPDGIDHLFKWDLPDSGFFGASDNVVFRIVVYPAHNVPGPFLRPYASATTFPFRVRGTQVQVVQESHATPLTGATVYRLPAGQARGATPLSTQPDRPPLRTNQQGYLPGHNIITPGDQLVALYPITSTSTYTLYHTSAAVTDTGLDLTPVEEPGTQTLTVSSNHSLVLFNLDIALEWDARQDRQYLVQLENDLKRTSELLFDWSDGQIALGNLTVYQDREHWNDVHVRIYATNRMRPSANKGGITNEGTERPDPMDAEILYYPGQVRMGAIWNRYGDTNANLSEDWPRALAHELGHFALFLDDNYLGIEDGKLISITGCPGAMSDPYLPDTDEFHPRDAQWESACQQTLSEHTTGRSDWESIQAFYDHADLDFYLRAPTTFNARSGPSQLPLAVTQVNFASLEQEEQPLEAPIFQITNKTSSSWIPGPNARAMVFRENRLVDLGQPTRDQVLARGARSGDRLCVYDLDDEHLGCRTITATQRELQLTKIAGWNPNIRMTPVTSTTLKVEVRDDSLDADDVVWAQLYPATTTLNDTTTLPPIQLEKDGDHYTTQITNPPDQPSFEGHLQVWVNAKNSPDCPDCREAVVDYLLGGNPGRAWARTAPRGSPGRAWARTAPVLSSDGQAIVYGDDVGLAEGDFFMLQSTVHLPRLPTWATPVGRGYRLTASSATMLQGTSLNIAYQGSDVPTNEEVGIQMYVWDEETDVPRWTPLETEVDVDRNMASAQVAGPGVYVLMSSIMIPLEGTGWQIMPYPGQTMSITDALAGIDGHYTTVYGYQANESDDPWKVYDVDVPEWVNDLTSVIYQNAYWIRVTKPLTLPIKGPRLQHGASSTMESSAIPTPPATYYMTLENMADLVPEVGLPVTATIDGQVCGQTTTRAVERGIVFAIDVVAASDDTTRGCGVIGRKITFAVGDTTLPTTASWNNQRPRELVYDQDTGVDRIYLPLIQR